MHIKVSLKGVERLVKAKVISYPYRSILRINNINVASAKEPMSHLGFIEFENKGPEHLYLDSDVGFAYYEGLITGLRGRRKKLTHFSFPDDGVFDQTGEQ